MLIQMFMLMVLYSNFIVQVTNEEVDEADEEEDLNKFGSQLVSIGIFARQVMVSS